MKKTVLVLGAGLVARPLVRYLLDNGARLVIATRTVDKAQALLDGHPSGTAVRLDLADPVDLDARIADSDVVVSLVPYTYHVQIARRCLALGKHLVTTSYVSNEMRELSAEAESKGLLFLNEIGLDPGIDHMSAMRVIHHVENAGGRILSFRSYCGGLPAPEANDNPWGYKFSWSPRGVLLAGRNASRWIEDGALREAPSEELFANNWPVDAAGVGMLEGYPNRDSTQYVGLYGLRHVRTMFRGTLRYPGWCRMMKGLVDIGWLQLSPPPAGSTTLGAVTAVLCGLAPSAPPDEIRKAAAARASLAPDGDAIRRMEWAGLFSSAPAAQAATILDVLGAVLEPRLAYRPGERDMIVLLHEFQAELADGRRQRITSTLVDFGVPGGDSAMSRTVSLPAAIAVKAMLDRKVTATGVRIPVDPAVYVPVLDGLEKTGIICREVFH
ncbi:MAG: saccharopine dehydrogenase [Deltaproteobacteria bacterium]|nr:saccharopine dehydrogenase [Deltaproteobacteria bacterium]